MFECPSTFRDMLGWLFQTKSGCSEALRECVLFSSPTGGHDVNWCHWCWFSHLMWNCPAAGLVGTLVKCPHACRYIKQLSSSWSARPTSLRKQGFYQETFVLWKSHGSMWSGRGGIPKAFPPCHGNVERFKKLWMGALVLEKETILV